MITAENLIPILGAELIRPRPSYFVRAICEPQVIWDASAQPGKQVRLDRYSFFGDGGDLSEDARARQPDQIIGANNSRRLNKQEMFVTLKEFTGPGGGDINDPSKPGNIRISYESIALAQRNIYDISVFENPTMRHQFHQSIGSEALLDDYQRWEDRVYIEKLLACNGRYNPGGIADGGTYASGPPKVTVNVDLKTIVERLKMANAPVFSDGYYRCVAHPRFIKHLRQDSAFTEVARYPGFAPVGAIVNQNPFLPPTIPHPNAIDQFNRPNQLIWAGGLAGQSTVGASPGMDAMFPTGFVFEGVRFFESTNMPTSLVSLNYTASTDPIRHPTGLAPREAFPGIFFGANVVGEAIATNEPVRCKANNNTDYGRFLIAIWQKFGGYANLNPDFGIVARTYGD